MMRRLLVVGGCLMVGSAFAQAPAPRVVPEFDFEAFALAQCPPESLAVIVERKDAGAIAHMTLRFERGGATLRVQDEAAYLGPKARVGDRICWIVEDGRDDDAR